ncbi:hypothetical protein SAMD00019534_038410, partial [Acytostelium subglobosum LB1]|uniref:hypothetical protein n=1 Tax=Acytostelium subglobosum LB1 TaxID=1410327 RepID=UPI000644A84E
LSIYLSRFLLHVIMRPKNNNSNAAGGGSSSSGVKTTLMRMFVVLIAFMTYNTMMYTSKQPNIQTLEKDHVDSYTALSEQQLARRLGDSIKFKTISFAHKDEINYQEFLDFHRFLNRTFPKVHNYLEINIINEYSLLMQWKGSDPDLKPAMLAAHFDVVPIANPDQWTHPPFDGVVDDQGFIWGRGSMDDKLAVMGILEAVEDLIEQGFRPQRSLYLALGHDEEIGGVDGAKHMAEYLKARGVQLEYILDEGLPIMRPPVLPGVTRKVAAIGMSEKGYITAVLNIKSDGGHSSMPPKNTAIGILAQAVAKLEANPLPAAFNEVALLLDFVGREATLPYRFVFSNLWLFRPLISYVLSLNPGMDPLQRTTTAVTMFNGGTKPNVLPNEANATINFRISPSQSVQDILDHIKNTINDDRIVTIIPEEFTEPSPISSADSPSFRLIQATVLQEFPEVIVAPGLMVANTDTKWYWDLSNNIYRFCPQELSHSDLKRFHGMDERLSSSDYRQLVDFYYHLIRNGDQLL